MNPSLTSRLYVLTALLVAAAPGLLVGQVADPDATRFADAIETFARYDANNSGKMDFKELQGVLRGNIPVAVKTLRVTKLTSTVLDKFKKELKVRAARVLIAI